MRPAGPVIVAVAPVFLQPTVEGAQPCVQRVHVVVHLVLHGQADTGEQQRRLDPLFVHKLEPRPPLHHRGVIVGVDHVDLAPAHVVDHALEELASAPGGAGVVGLGDLHHPELLVAEVQATEAVRAGHNVPTPVPELVLEVPRERVVRFE